MNSYTEVAKHISCLIDNRATMLEVADYLLEFVKQQCEVTQDVIQVVVNKTLAEREAQVRAEEREKVRELEQVLKITRRNILEWNDFFGDNKERYESAWVLERINVALASYNQHTEKKG
jgi:hypothetical protein